MNSLCDECADCILSPEPYTLKLADSRTLPHAVALRTRNDTNQAPSFPLIYKGESDSKRVRSGISPCTPIRIEIPFPLELTVNFIGDAPI